MPEIIPESTTDTVHLEIARFCDFISGIRSRRELGQPYTIDSPIPLLPPLISSFIAKLLTEHLSPTLCDGVVVVIWYWMRLAMRVNWVELEGMWG